MTDHLWQGEWIDDPEAWRRLENLDGTVCAALARPVSTDVLLGACGRVAATLADAADPLTVRLTGCLRRAGLPAPAAAGALANLAAGLDPDVLRRKLFRELGETDPARLARRYLRPDTGGVDGATVFESWAPLGLLVHVLPGNAIGVGPLSVLEGLLAGNINIAKTSRHDHRFTQELLAALGAADPSGRIAEHVVVLSFGSGRAGWLDALCAAADGVAVWGSEEAVTGVSDRLPAGCRLIEWGPKISFAYLTRDSFTAADALRALAEDVCAVNQQACSSPQVAYLDTDDPAELFDFAERFAAALAKVGENFPPATPDPMERAEITAVLAVAKTERHLGLTRVHEDPDGGWRIVADTRPALTTSPLFRTVLVKPLPRQEITTTLRPMRRWLQAAGLAAPRTDTVELTRGLLAAGVDRVVTLGTVHTGYPGEPHDGVYALQRYSRRVTARFDERFAGDWCLDDLIAPAEPWIPDVPVMSKADFQASGPRPEYAHLYFASGGSSGEPALSVFSHDDYREQMRRSAGGLLAAGLDPERDRVMNLFHSGSLYGSFISIFSILEALRATQFPMTSHPDHEMVARTIARNNVDTLLGMPSYLLRLFDAGADVLGEYRGVRKIFYGGEPMSAPQRRRLREEFGVEIVRSAAYGSVDAGSLGYQCQYAEGGVHHLFTSLQALEILDRDSDRPVAPGEPGRLVFTTHTRSAQRVWRYELGDLGRWVPGECPCGHRTPRFELLGRFGDVFRPSGAPFLNYRRFANTAHEHLDYAGELQLVLDTGGAGTARDRLTVLLAAGADTGTAADAFRANDPALADAVARDLIQFAVHAVPAAEFHRTGRGKLRHVVDRRPANP